MINRLDFIGVPSQDAERSRSFYIDTLGLRPDEHGHFEAWLGETCFGIWEPKSFGMPFAPQKNAHPALHVDDVAAARADVGPGYDVTDPPEPAQLVEAWERLVESVRSKIDERLEDEVVESAARSFAGYEIEKLPEHLRTAARTRRRRLSTELAKARQAPSAADSS